jgi:hypothetical protein
LDLIITLGNKMKKMLATLVLALSFSSHAAEFVSFGVIKGSITDYHPNIEVLSRSFNWQHIQDSMHSNIERKLHESVKRFIESEIKPWCEKKYKGREGKVFYGIDNVSFSTKHLETNDNYGKEGSATFNMICAA